MACSDGAPSPSLAPPTPVAVPPSAEASPVAASSVVKFEPTPLGATKKGNATVEVEELPPPLTVQEWLRVHMASIIKVIVVVMVAALIMTLVGVQAIEGDPCNSTLANTTSGELASDEPAGVSSFVGIAIACIANSFNGGGMSLQKVGHNAVAAAAGGADKVDTNSVGHFKQPMWWLGLLLIILGEGGNAFAYGLAPASTVAPFGGVGVFTNYVIAVLCLGEKSSVQSIFGICLIALGVVLTTLAVPESSVAYTAHELLSEQAFLSHRAFWYIMSTIVVVLLIAVKLEKDYADRFIYVWAVYASIVSSWTVIACRGLFSMIAQVPSDCSEQCHHDELHWPCQSTLGHWMFWLSAVVIGGTAYWANGVIEQKGMMRYGQTEWVPLHYCVFTLFCIVGGAMVYNEFEHLTGQGWVMFSCGGASCLLGVVALTTPHRLVFATSPLSVHYEKQGDDYEHQTLDEKLDSLRLQRQSSRDVYSPGGSLANLGIEIIAEADSPSSRRSRLEDAHYPGSAAAARVTAVLAPEALPFESKLTKSSARLLGTRRQLSRASRSNKGKAREDEAQSERSGGAIVPSDV
jgi:drug/metabolite transporter (DMT)-like permease